MLIRFVFALLIITGYAPQAQSAEPSPSEIELRLQLIQVKREKAASDYRLGEAMMRAAQLEDEKLRAEDAALKAKLNDLAAKEKAAK